MREREAGKESEIKTIGEVSRASIKAVLSSPNSRSSSRDPDNRNSPTRAIRTANHVDREGKALCFEVGTGHES